MTGYINRDRAELLRLAKRYMKQDKNGPRIYVDDTANWNQQIDYIAEKGNVYIYTDKQYTDEYGNPLIAPGVKVGDGLAYLIDTPFLDELIADEVISAISAASGSVTPEDREFWNNKVSSFFRNGDPENLVLSKTQYSTIGDVIDG